MKTHTRLLLPLSLLALGLHAQVGTEQATSPESAVEPRSEVTTPSTPNAGPIMVQPVVPAPGVPAPQAEATAGAALEKLVDSRLENISLSIENAPTSEERETARAQLATLRERRDQLKSNFNQAEFDRLIEDTRAEYARVASFSSKRTGDNATAPGDPSTNTGSAAPSGLDRTYAALNLPANQALANIEVYRMNPTPGNKDEVKTALKALDNEIDRLSDQAGKLPRGEERDSAKRRVKALKERYSELKGDFTKARWEAMLSELRTEWGRIVH